MTNKKKKVLVVDDEPDTVTTLKFLLEQAGFEVATAVNGYEALGAMVAEDPDLIILDVLLPKINGYEVSRIVKEEARRGAFRREIPILVLTGAKFSDSDKEKLFHTWSMADAFMYKPFELGEMERKVRELLERG